MGRRLSHSMSTMRKMSNHMNTARWICILYLLQSFVGNTVVNAKRNQPKKGDNHPNSFPYLYATKNDPNASKPVIDYIAPLSKRELENDKPWFLYDHAHQGYRIVEFYGHWCSTCKNFKPHFIHFANKVQQIAQHHNETVQVYAVSCHPNRKLCRKQTAQGYPLIRLLSPGASKGIDMQHTEIHPVTVLQKMGMQLSKQEVELEWDDNDVSASTKTAKTHPAVWQRMVDQTLGTHWFDDASSATRFERRTRDQLKADIHLSFDFAMRDGVFKSEHALEADAALALKDWLKLLYKTLPVGWELHALLNELIKDFKYVSKHEAYLYNILDQHPPPSKVWSHACSHGDIDAGYTCGLWELFHSMTVGVVDYNYMVHEKKRIPTQDAAMRLRNYIDFFFGCAECRSNFLTSFDNCAHNRCNRLQKEAKGEAKESLTLWGQLPLWLFEVHNSVNVRLVKEQAQRQGRTVTIDEEIDALWPPQRDCLPCWDTDRETGQLKPNPTNIYKWLHLEYAQRDPNSSKEHAQLVALHAAAERKVRRKQQGIVVSKGTVLVGICILVLLSLKVRRRRLTGRHKKFEEDNKRRPFLDDGLHGSPPNSPKRTMVRQSVSMDGGVVTRQLSSRRLVSSPPASPVRNVRRDVSMTHRNHL